MSSVQLDSQTRALLWTAKVAARNLRASVQRLKDCPPSEITARLKQVSAEAEILSKSAEKLGRIDLPSESEIHNEPPPMNDTILVLAKTLHAIETGALKPCPKCGKFNTVSDHDSIEGGAPIDGHAKNRARQRAHEARR